MTSDLDQRKDAMRAPWLAGDLGALMRALGAGAAEDFVAGLGDIAGCRVLDIACGAGTSTLPLARRGATVTGLDLAPNLLAQARDDAAAAGLAIHFDEGFAEDLPYPAGSFDLVTSMVGVMFSPFQERIAAELDRVLVPGGRLALANWTASGVNGGISKLAARYSSPPSTDPPTFSWSDETAMRTLLDPFFADIGMRRVSVSWDVPGSPADLVDLFVAHSGPMQLMLARFSDADRSALLADIHRLFADANEALAGSGRTSVANEYLEIRATRRTVAATPPERRK